MGARRRPLVRNVRAVFAQKKLNNNAGSAEPKFNSVCRNDEFEC